MSVPFSAWARRSVPVRRIGNIFMSENGKEGDITADSSLGRKTLIGEEGMHVHGRIKSG